MSQRSVYLHDIPLDKAWQRLITALAEASLWQPFPGETVPLDQALGRVTAAPVWARLSSPHYHASAMDGYAVRARDTDAATETSPVQLEIESQAKYVDTGDPLPGWADAVIPIENVQVMEVTHIEIRASVTPWSHVRPMGEDMVATELVMPANHTLRPVDLGAIAGCGHSAVRVRRKPRV
ncbi:MAG: molybdopterin biosynthesis protein, partial [Anaerolineales bacterium]